LFRGGENNSRGGIPVKKFIPGAGGCTKGYNRKIDGILGRALKSEQKPGIGQGVIWKGTEPRKKTWKGFVGLAVKKSIVSEGGVEFDGNRVWGMFWTKSSVRRSGGFRP